MQRKKFKHALSRLQGAVQEKQSVKKGDEGETGARSAMLDEQK